MAPTTKENALAKARKLWALAERPGTPAEGETARTFCRTLMNQWGFTPADMTPPATPRSAPPAAIRTCQCGEIEVIVRVGSMRMSNFSSAGRCPRCEQAACRDAARRQREKEEREKVEQEAARILQEQLRQQAANRREREANKRRILKEQAERERQQEARPEHAAKRGGEKCYFARDYDWSHFEHSTGKGAILWTMMNRLGGATVSELMEGLGWRKAASVRGFISQLKTSSIKQ